MYLPNKGLLTSHLGTTLTASAMKIFKHAAKLFQAIIAAAGISIQTLHRRCKVSVCLLKTVPSLLLVSVNYPIPEVLKSFVKLLAGVHGAHRFKFVGSDFQANQSLHPSEIGQ